MSLGGTLDNSTAYRYTKDEEVNSMYLNEILTQKNMSKYNLAKISGISQSTIMDICNGKSSISKCSSITIYKIAKALDITMESLIENELCRNTLTNTNRTTFDVYKSNICHLVKFKGDIDFMIDVLKSDEIRTLYNKKWYAEAFYLLAMVDYLSRLNNIPLCTNYNDLRTLSLDTLVFPSSARLIDKLSGNNNFTRELLANAIPEFLRFNIVEGEIRNVC